MKHARDRWLMMLAAVAMLTGFPAGVEAQIGPQAIQASDRKVDDSGWIRAIEVLTPGIRSKDDDWPVADCSLIAESAVSWQGLTTAIETLEAAEAAVMLAKPACDSIATIEVISTPLTVAGECVGGGFLEGFIEGSIEVTTEAVFTWEGGRNNPALCAGAETAMEAAWKASEIVSGYLECWTDAYLDSNYERLDTLQDEILEAYDDLELIYNIFVERSLHKTGGSSLAALYLPESAGGELESVAEIVTNAGENTAAAGYILDENFETILSAAEEAQEADHYKRALSLYRKAYQHATIQSEELADSETP